MLNKERFLTHRKPLGGPKENVRRLAAAVGIGVAGLVLAGCTSSESGGVPESEPPSTTPVTITVTDEPMSSDSSCPASIGFPAYQHTVKPEGTKLTIKDATGTTVSLSDLGPVTKVSDECRWEWEVDLPQPESDFYTLSWGSDANTFTSNWMGEQDTTVGTAELSATKAELIDGVSIEMSDHIGAWNSN